MNIKEKFNQKNTFQKSMIIIACVALSLFLALNVFWLAYREIRFAPLRSETEHSIMGWTAQKGGWHYAVEQPSYLSFNGNLSMSDDQSDDGLVVICDFPSGYTYLVVMEVGKIRSKTDGRMVPLTAFMEVDENGEWIDTEYNKNFGKKEKDAVKNRKDDIKKWIQMADDMWDLKE